MRRRSYALAIVACLIGAGLALYAITRTWSIHLTPRPGMSALREARTGTDLEPWVTGLALVALAGAGALLATAGWVRRALGVVLALAGVGVVIGAVVGRVGLDPGSAGAGGTAWPILGAAGGLIIIAGGSIAARHGHEWPGMSARYDRKPVPPPRSAGEKAAAGNDTGEKAAARDDTGEKAAARDDTGEKAAAERPEPVVADHRAAWDALDRGDDPTAG